MHRCPRLAAVLLLLPAGVLPLAARQGERRVDPALLAGMKARSIGPAGMSGRVAAIEVVPGDPDVVYVGAATGGLWKSINGGLNFDPIFDDQPVASIGAVAVHPLRHDVVWVGTGEGNPRNSVSVGNGVYRSLDGGRTWTHLGLEETERIPRIRLHPLDPDVAYVAALGHTWGPGPERGVFKTSDGGRTWKKVLYVDETTGAADLEMDPSNPDKLLAAMWDHRRWPWFFRSGGPGSGLYLTYDGGETWKRIGHHEGLPEGDLGRIGLAVAPSRPSLVYALIEAKRIGVYRSEDGGEHWSLVTDEGDFGNRPFYFADLHVDPQDPARVYSLWSLASVSNDEGKTWAPLIPFSALHPDHHAMWIDPRDPMHIWDGNDGGIGVSRDRGKTWRFVSNLPLAQFYHIALDDDLPYHVYGGMQDNGSWRGPSEVWENGGIRNHHWEEVGFGDGFDTRPDPADSMTGYSMSQEGFLVRWDLHTGERKMIRPAPPDPGTELRFNWNAALALDPFVPGTIYFGSQFVHASPDRGKTWKIISPDLTTNNPDWQRQKQSGGVTLDVTGAENFTTIVTIAPSPLERGVIWVGTDDGRVQVTRDAGSSWSSVERGARGVPKNTWVPQITPSHHVPGVAYVVFDDHRRSNGETYLYRAERYGRAWKRLPTGGVRGYALCVEEDPVDPDLVFLGTEFGLWVSLDGGRIWLPWTYGVPTVAVRDMAIQPRTGDLVLGTHGRAAYVLDDIRPLRELSAEVLAEPLHLFPIPAAQQHRVKQTGASRFPGHGEFRGANRPYGALVTFSLNVEGLPHPDEEVERAREEDKSAAKQGPLTLPGGIPVPEPPSAGPQEAETEEEAPQGEEQGKAEEEKPKARILVADAAGRTIRTFERPVTLGVNRVVWGLESDPFRRPPPASEGEEDEERRSGPEVVPGDYTITVKYGDHEASGSVRVLPDPRFSIPSGDREARWNAVQRAGRLREKNTEAILRIQRTRADLEAVVRMAEAEEKDRKAAARRRGEAPAGDEGPEAAEKTIGGRAKKVLDRLHEMEEKFWDPPKSQEIRGDVSASDAVGVAQWFLGSSWDGPTPSQLAYLDRAQRRLEAALEELNRFFEEEVAPLRSAVREAGMELLPEMEPLRVDGSDSP